MHSLLNVKTAKKLETCEINYCCNYSKLVQESCQSLFKKVLDYSTYSISKTVCHLSILTP